jgi:hypothetical protein
MSVVTVVAKTPDGADVTMQMTKCDGPGCSNSSATLPPGWYTIQLGAGYPSYGQFCQWAHLVAWVSQHPVDPQQEPAT